MRCNVCDKKVTGRTATGEFQSTCSEKCKNKRTKNRASGGFAHAQYKEDADSGLRN